MRAGRFCSIFLLAEILAGTWNLRWFPSGLAEHRAEPEVEARNMREAAETLRGELAGAKGGAVVFLQEMRRHETAEELVKEIGVTNLRVAVTTAFRSYDRRLGWQQCAIATTYPVLEANWSYWRHSRKTYPPRGYAYALVDAGKDGLVACYCVHLKSNYGANTEEKAAQNRLKREVCAEQLVQMAKKVRAPDGRKVSKVLVGGDFNMDMFGKYFAGDKTVELLEGGGFACCWEPGTPEEKRLTHRRGRRGSTLDYVLGKGLERAGEPRLSGKREVSDHCALWTVWE